MIGSSSVCGVGGSVKRRLVVWAVMLVVVSFWFASSVLGAEVSGQTADDGGVGGETGECSGWDDPITSWPVLSVSETLLEDLEGVAEEFGISLEEAVRRYGWHNEFAALVSDIRTAYPAEFSASAIGDDDKPWISFARKAPPDAVALLCGFVVPVRIVEDTGFTEVDMVRWLRAIHYSVVSDDRITDARSGYDIVTGVFDVTVTYTGDESAAVVVNELREALPEEIRSLGLVIEFLVVDFPVIGLDAGLFGDDDGSVHEAAIDALAETGVVDGTECGEGLFCPADPILRWVMAVWLIRALGESPSTEAGTRFGDVDAAEWWTPHVERLADLGITHGCGTEPLRFCPHEAVNRGQMATLLVRAVGLDAADPAGFVDTAGTTHETNIDALAAAGVTAGCAKDPLRYCPTEATTRAQMATFLARAFGLLPPPDTDSGTTAPQVGWSSVAAGSA